MTRATVTRLVPAPIVELPLKGLYLAHEIREKGRQGRPFLYTNFVTSLDGRIATRKQDGDGYEVPPQIANPRDWRLFRELSVQADVVVVAGSYMERRSRGQTESDMQGDDDTDRDELRAWRTSQGEEPYPDYAVVSNRLSFDVTKSMLSRRKRIVVLTGQDSSPDHRQRLVDQGAQVLVLPQKRVEGKNLVQALAQLGYRAIYAPAGPAVLHMLFAAAVIDRLYLTHVHRVIAGDPYLTLAEGHLLTPPPTFTLSALHLDAMAAVPQHFAVYDRLRQGSEQ